MCTQKGIIYLLYFSCALILGIGSVLIWVGYLIQASAFVSILKYTYTGYIVVACGGYLIFLSFFGLVGAWKQHRCLLGIYIVFSIVVGILLICFGGTLISLRSVSEEYLNDEKSCIDHFFNANDASVHAAEVFCTLYCPCSLNTAKLDIQLDNFYRGSAKSVLQCEPCELADTYSAEEQQQLIIWVNETLKVDLNGTNCTLTSATYKDRYFTSVQEKYFALITWIEEKFDCSGLCTHQNLLMFSDVNNGKPDTACYSSLNEWAKQNFLNYGIISIVLGFFQLTVIILASSLCCCTKRTVNLEPPISNKALSEDDEKNKTVSFKKTLELDETGEVQAHTKHEKIDNKEFDKRINVGDHRQNNIIEDHKNSGFVRRSNIQTPFSRNSKK